MATSASRRDKYRRIADRARRIPALHGLRQQRVYLVEGTWSGTHTGDGSETQNVIELTVLGGHPPKVRDLNDEQLALGNLSRGAVMVGPLTPKHSAGGIDYADLFARNVARGNTLRLRIDGPRGQIYYDITSVKVDRSLRVMIQATPRGEAVNA